MRIAIFETEHFEVAYPLIRLFDNNSNEITIFVYANAYRQLGYLLNEDLHRYTWVVKQNNESKYAFMYRMYTEVKKKNIELLYLSTVSDNYLLYYVLVRMVKVRTILTLHAINGFFCSRPGGNIRGQLNYAGMKLLISAIREFNVISLTMVSYLQNKLPAFKRVHCIPGAVYEPPQLQNNSLPVLTRMIQLVVPGTIDNRRRNYDLVFDLLEASRQVSLPVSIVLLGGHYGEYGKQVLDKCRQYIQYNSNLRFYETDAVEQPEYNRVMQHAHFVLMPCVTRAVVFGYAEERYGISKSSGNIYDVVRYAKPFIAPASLPFDACLEDSCIRYSEVNDIILYLKFLLLQPERYDTLRQNAVTASMQYTVTAIRKRNAGIFL